MEVFWNYLVVVVIPVILYLLILAFGTVQGTEILKRLTAFLGDKFSATWLKLSGFGTFIVALALAVYLAMGLDISIFEPFGLEYDPQMLEVFSGVIASLFANWLHDKKKLG